MDRGAWRGVVDLTGTTWRDVRWGVARRAGTDLVGLAGCVHGDGGATGGTSFAGGKRGFARILPIPRACRRAPFNKKGALGQMDLRGSVGWLSAGLAFVCGWIVCRHIPSTSTRYCC